MSKVYCLLPDHKKHWLIDDLIYFYYQFWQDEHPDLTVNYMLGTDTYCIINYKSGRLHKIIQASPARKSNGPLGINITHNLSLVSKKYIVDSLKGYFTLPTDDNGTTGFLNKKDLIYDLVKIIDIKAKSYSGDPSVKSSMKLFLPENLVTREKDYKCHGFKIPYYRIKKALESISEHLYIHIHLWFFPQIRLGLSDIWVKEYLKARSYKQSGSVKKYHKARRAKEKALSELANILIRDWDNI